MKKIAVIGSGSIGPDLCYGFASALANEEACIILHDISEQQLKAGMDRIRAYLAKGVDRGKFSTSKAERIEKSILPSLELSDLAGCSYVLEAATENLDLKKKILATLESVVDENCLIGFATSGIPRSQIVDEVKFPDRCFVNHPFYPAWRSQPVELVPSANPELTQQMFDTLQALGKVPVITKDVHCFAADDVFCNFECEAFRLLEEGVANLWQIDRIINESIGGGGPFRVADMTRGNLLIDHCQQLMVEANAGNSWFKSPPILLKQANAIWRDKSVRQSSEYTPELAKLVMDRILAVLFARSFYIVDHDICAPGDLDWLLKNSLGFKQGILELAAETGMDEVRRLCLAYREHDENFIVPQSILDETFPEFYRNIVISDADEDGLVLLQIRRPEVVNALNAQTVSELRSAFENLNRNKEVRGIIFSGFGPGMAGADILELAALPDAASCEAICEGGQLLSLEMEALSKPVVAAVSGPVLGGCAEMCMAAWARVVSKDALIGQPEVNLGIVPGYGATQRLPRIIGLENAARILRRAETFGAARACEMGWATGTPVHDAIEGARQLLQSHLKESTTLSPLDHSPVIGDTECAWIDIGFHSTVIDDVLRDIIQNGLKMPLAEGMKYEAAGFGRCRSTQDMRIGLANFMQNGPIPAVFINS